MAILLWHRLRTHQRPGVQEPGEGPGEGPGDPLQVLHLGLGDTLSLVADELGYSLQYLLFCIKLEAADY